LPNPILGNGFRTVASGNQNGFVEERINSSRRAPRHFKAKTTIQSGRGPRITLRSRGKALRFKEYGAAPLQMLGNSMRLIARGRFTAVDERHWAVDQLDQKDQGRYLRKVHARWTCFPHWRTI
jgi:hypothetical protein